MAVYTIARSTWTARHLALCKGPNTETSGRSPKLAASTVTMSDGRPERLEQSDVLSPAFGPTRRTDVRLQGRSGSAPSLRLHRQPRTDEVDVEGQARAVGVVGLEASTVIEEE